MKKSNLISGIFVDREAGDLEGEIVDVSDEDVANFVEGRYGFLTRRKVEYLRELQSDPFGKKWDAAHADYVFVDEETFFEFLFVHFPAWEGWEKNYQDLRKMVGEKPIDSVDLWMVAMELNKNAGGLRRMQNFAKSDVSTTPAARATARSAFREVRAESGHGSNLNLNP